MARKLLIRRFGSGLSTKRAFTTSKRAYLTVKSPSKRPKKWYNATIISKKQAKFYYNFKYLGSFSTVFNVFKGNISKKLHHLIFLFTVN